MQSQQNLRPPQDVYGTGCVWKSSGRNSEGNLQANVVLLSAPKHILSWLVNSTIWARSFFPVGFFSPPFSGWGKPCMHQGLQHADRSGHCWWLPRPPLLAPWQEPRQLGRLLPAPPVSASLLLHTNPDTSSERDPLSLEMECYDQGLSSGGEKESHRILEPAKSTYVFLWPEFLSSENYQNKQSFRCFLCLCGGLASTLQVGFRRGGESIKGASGCGPSQQCVETFLSKSKEKNDPTTTKEDPVGPKEEDSAGKEDSQGQGSPTGFTQETQETAHSLPACKGSQRTEDRGLQKSEL